MQYKNTIQHSFSNLLQSNSELQKFVAKIEHLSQISQKLESMLEPELAAQCQVANLRNGTLIISTTSPAWNHRLRFSSLDLLSSLRADPRWAGLKSIEIRIDYLPQPLDDTTTSSKKPKALSKKTAKLLEEAARSIKYSKLSESMKRLAEKAK